MAPQLSTERSDTLTIPDPNVRVQAVIDGQGVALTDVLVDQELQSGTLHRLCDAELSDYGYYLTYTKAAVSNPEAEKFSAWIKNQTDFDVA